MSWLATNGSAERSTPSVTESLDRMVDAAQKVVGDEVSLLRMEVSAAVSRALRSGAMLFLGTVLLAIGWVIVQMAAFHLLAPRLGTLGTLAALAAVNLLPGIALLMGVRRGWAEVGHG
jgi:Putative Actinobacterial Holin-X, holin superfamily III